MLSKLSDKMVNYAIKERTIAADKYDEYFYGLNLLFDFLINEITIIIFGCLFHMFWECILFWIIYQGLRKYCGGFHFSTPYRCYMSVFIMCPLILCIIKYIEISAPLMWAITFIAVVILSILAPVDAANKPLDNAEKRVFRKISLILILIFTVLYIAVAAIKLNTAVEIMSLSIMSVAVFSVIGKCQLIILEHRKNMAS